MDALMNCDSCRARTMERDNFMLVFTLMFDGTITSSMCVRKSCGLLDTRKAMYIMGAWVKNDIHTWVEPQLGEVLDFM
jgi:hypothetical protein